MPSLSLSRTRVAPGRPTIVLPLIADDHARKSRQHFHFDLPRSAPTRESLNVGTHDKKVPLATDCVVNMPPSRFGVCMPTEQRCKCLCRGFTCLWAYLFLAGCIACFQIARNGATPIVTEVTETLHGANSMFSHANGAAFSLDELLNISSTAAHRAAPAADHLVSMLNESVSLVDRVNRLVQRPKITLSMDPSVN